MLIWKYWRRVKIGLLGLIAVTWQQWSVATLKMLQCTRDPTHCVLGSKQLRSFWSGLLSAGACELVYSNIRLTIEGEGRARLAADWSMNVAAGVITNELWIRQEDGQWLIAQDDFDILRQSTGNITEFVSQFHAHFNCMVCWGPMTQAPYGLL